PGESDAARVDDRLDVGRPIRGELSSNGLADEFALGTDVIARCGRSGHGRLRRRVADMPTGRRYKVRALGDGQVQRGEPAVLELCQRGLAAEADLCPGGYPQW